MNKVINTVVVMLLDVVALVALYLVGTVEPSLYWFISQPVVLLAIGISYTSVSVYRIIEIIVEILNEHKSLQTMKEVE